jgi:branched-chain amino acid transport system ATP-binding protein
MAENTAYRIPRTGISAKEFAERGISAYIPAHHAISVGDYASYAGATAEETILEVRDVTIRFGGLTAVSDVSLRQADGEILSLIGPNGAGKTTFFNLLTGVYTPNEGAIIFGGKNITKVRAHERARAGIARTFQNIRLFSTLTVLENILVATPECNREGLLSTVLFPGSLRARRREIVEKCRGLLDLIGLSGQEGEMAASLPYGKQRLLEIARGLATGPKLLLLDEPGAGMNSFEKDELTKVIRHITGELGINVLIIEHDMKFVMGISDRIAVLDHGEKIAEGAPSAIQNDERVIQAYLGSGKFGDEEDAEL